MLPLWPLGSRVPWLWGLKPCGLVASGSLVGPSHARPFMRHMCGCVHLSGSVRPGGHAEARQRLLHGETSVFCRTSTVSDVLLQGTHFFNKTKMRHGNQGNRILNVYGR